MSDLASIVIVTGGVITALGIIGTFLAWLIVPRLKAWLVKEIADPVQETHQQTTVNGGKNDPPTLPDKLATIDNSVRDLTAKVDKLADQDTGMQANLTALALVMDEHLRWSREWVEHHGGDTPPEPE